MPKPRWNLSDLILLIVICGISFAAYRYFWQPAPDPNARPNLFSFLAFLTLASLGSFFARPKWRRSCQAFAAFGWLDLILCMWGSLSLKNHEESTLIIECAQIGMVFGLLCGIVAGWLFEPVRQNGDARAFASDQSGD
jgi:hypothetical protein